ncbi:MAG: GTP 3',8-cyclase MoaA [bacterium]
MLKDNYHRKIDYLRISITDRCNLRCIYCMPSQRVHLQHKELLSYEEILKITQLAVDCGILRVRITGGEPFIRRGMLDFVRELVKIKSLEEVSMTTNGILLRNFALDLKKVGLNRINVSLDTLIPEKYKKITRVGDINQVLMGIQKAKEAALVPVKINTVIIRGFNDNEVLDFAKLAFNDKNISIRFIEFMPLCPGNIWEKERYVPNNELISKISDWEPLIPISIDSKGGPAQVYRFKNGCGKIGFISPISNHFCAKCNRLRLTADGHLRGCLFSDQEIDICSSLRARVGDSELKKLILSAIRHKPKKHYLEQKLDNCCERPMSEIGG